MRSPGRGLQWDDRVLPDFEECMIKKGSGLRYWDLKIYFDPIFPKMTNTNSTYPLQEQNTAISQTNDAIFLLIDYSAK